MPAGSKLGPLQVVVADHVEDLALSKREDDSDGSLAVLVGEFLAGKQDLNAGRIDDADGVRRTFEPPLRVIRAVHDAFEEWIVLALDLDTDEVVGGRALVVFDEAGERRLDDVLERPIGGEQTSTGCNESADLADSAR